MSIIFLLGVKKDQILNVTKPNIVYGDQWFLLESDAGDIPMVYIPFGMSNLDLRLLHFDIVSLSI